MITVKYCELFEFECPLDWDDLIKTDDIYVRYCDMCERKVHFCVSDTEYEKHKKLGNCVAVDIIKPGDNYPRRLGGIPRKY
jgi:hypothetical protein